MMTDEELKEIRERAEKATPGPWLGLYLSGDTINGVKNAPGAVGLGEVGLTAADHKFITHAREDIPALLAEVEWLRDACNRLLQIADLAAYYAPGELGESYGKMIADIDFARGVLGAPSRES